jgi:hypothetical protein
MTGEHDGRVGRASGTGEWDGRVGRASGTGEWDGRVGRASMTGERDGPLRLREAIHHTVPFDAASFQLGHRQLRYRSFKFRKPV